MLNLRTSDNGAQRDEIFEESKRSAELRAVRQYHFLRRETLRSLTDSFIAPSRQQKAAGGLSVGGREVCLIQLNYGSFAV